MVAIFKSPRSRTGGEAFGQSFGRGIENEIDIRRNIEAQGALQKLLSDQKVEQQSKMQQQQFQRMDTAIDSIFDPSIVRHNINLSSSAVIVPALALTPSLITVKQL